MNENIQNAKALFAPVPRVQLGFFPTPFYKLAAHVEGAWREPLLSSATILPA